MSQIGLLGVVGAIIIAFVAAVAVIAVIDIAAALFLTVAFVIRGRGWKVAALTFAASAVLFGLSLLAGTI